MIIIETAVHIFVQHYRATFPSATFLPKLHMLEDHLIPWVKRWRVGCGCMGEQGAESLHAAFNNTERAYKNMRDSVDRLLQNHHFRILPCNEALQPPLLKKKKRRRAKMKRHYNQCIYSTHIRAHYTRNIYSCKKF